MNVWGGGSFRHRIFPLVRVVQICPGGSAHPSPTGNTPSSGRGQIRPPRRSRSPVGVRAFLNPPGFLSSPWGREGGGGVPAEIHPPKLGGTRSLKRSRYSGGRSKRTLQKRSQKKSSHFSKKYRLERDTCDPPLGGGGGHTYPILTNCWCPAGVKKAVGYTNQHWLTSISPRGVLWIFKSILLPSGERRMVHGLKRGAGGGHSPVSCARARWCAAARALSTDPQGGIQKTGGGTPKKSPHPPWCI